MPQRSLKQESHILENAKSHILFKNSDGDRMVSAVFREDINQITTSPEIPWEDFKDSTVLVTGATGLIGNALVHALSAANTRYGLDMRIIAHGKNAENGRLLAKEADGAEVVCSDIRNPLTSIGIITERLDYVIHCAALAKSPDMVSIPADVAEVSLKGTMNALQLALEKKIKSMVFVSSMEVYGITDPALASVSENDLGSLDIKSPRSCYPESKRMCECLCNCYYAQYGTPVKTARLAQTFGVGTPVNDTLVVAQFGRNAIAGEDIVLHTEGNSQGNYCYISDTIRALLLILLKGENGEAYNISNRDASMKIRDMAKLVAENVCKGTISVTVNRPPDIDKRGYSPDVTRVLCADKLIKLGWQPEYGLAEMYTRMIRDWKEKGI